MVMVKRIYTLTMMCCGGPKAAFSAGKVQRGWSLYTPLIDDLIGAGVDPGGNEFADCGQRFVAADRFVKGFAGRRANTLNRTVRENVTNNIRNAAIECRRGPDQ